LLLQFVHRETGIEPADLEIPELDAEIILRFLDALEKDRGNTVVSRNLRRSLRCSAFTLPGDSRTMSSAEVSAIAPTRAPEVQST
jgi:integrase/recombinase XerD